MAVRIPVKEVELGSSGTAHRFQRCSQAEVNRIMYEMIRGYGTSPSATISVGTGNFGNISDTRLEVGAAGSDSTDFDTESETADVSTETVNYNKLVGSFYGNNPITITRGSDPSHTAISNLMSGSAPHGFPLFMTFSGSNSNVQLQEFSLQDMIDTFWKPAAAILVGNSQSEGNSAGTYAIESSTTSTGDTLSDRTKISTTPIFTDTRATASDYSAAGIPEAADQQDVVAYYHLYRWDREDTASTLNTLAGANLPHLLAHTVSGGGLAYERIRHVDLTNQLAAIARYAAINESSYRIKYELATSLSGGMNYRDAVTDTRLDGSTYLTNQVGDDYRSQEVPSGSATTISTYKFGVGLA